MQHQKTIGWNVDDPTRGLVAHINTEFTRNVFQIKESFSARCSNVTSCLRHMLLILSVEGSRNVSRRAEAFSDQRDILLLPSILKKKITQRACDVISESTSQGEFSTMKFTSLFELHAMTKDSTVTRERSEDTEGGIDYCELCKILVWWLDG